MGQVYILVSTLRLLETCILLLQVPPHPTWAVEQNGVGDHFLLRGVWAVLRARARGR